jgi:hypothetical protein
MPPVVTPCEAKAIMLNIAIGYFAIVIVVVCGQFAFACLRKAYEKVVRPLAYFTLLAMSFCLTAASLFAVGEEVSNRIGINNGTCDGMEL